MCYGGPGGYLWRSICISDTRSCSDIIGDIMGLFAARGSQDDLLAAF